MSTPPWWSAKVATAPPLRLEDIQREMQRVAICGLCGLAIAGAPAVHHDETQGVVHRICPP